MIQIGGCCLGGCGVLIGARPPPLPDHPMIRAPVQVITDWAVHQGILQGPWIRLFQNGRPISVPQACLQVRQEPSKLATDTEPAIRTPYPVNVPPTPENLAWLATQANMYTRLEDAQGKEVWVPTACLRLQQPIEI